MQEDQNTEQKILSAAEKVFLLLGFDGARMQEIANLANINKAMLHYYFRSKDALFERIFDEKVKFFLPELSEIMLGQGSFIEKADGFIDKYISLMIKYPFIPHFVLNTINKQNGQEFIKKLPTHLILSLVKSYESAKNKGEVRDLDPLQLIISIIAMCAFPFIAKPIIQKSADLDQKGFLVLMENRKNELKQYLRLIIQP